MEVEKILEKITQKRSQKGYTYENMADDLGLTPSGYRKIEKGETKLSVEKMFQISTVLDIPINELLDIGENWIQNNSYNKDSSISAQKIEHFYQENKEITEQLIRAKDELILQLQKEVEFLKSKILS